MHHEGQKLTVGTSIRCSRHNYCSFSMILSSISCQEFKDHSSTCSKLTSTDMAKHITKFINKHDLNNNVAGDDVHGALVSPITKQSSKPIVSSQSSSTESSQSSKSTVATKSSKRQRIDIIPPPSQAQSKQDYCYYILINLML